MQGLEPQQVQSKDVLTWFNQSFQLIHRYLSSYLISVALFFVSLFVISQAMQSVQHIVPPLILLVLFLIASAFVFYFFIAGLVMISHCSDHSQNINMSSIIQHFLPGQKAFLQMTFIAISAGIFYWYVSVLLNPGSNMIVMSEKTISLLTDETTSIFYILKTSAVFMYFLLMVMFSLRTFFSAPLVIFHGLDYQESKLLSHKAIFKNIKPMSHVVISWFVIFFISIAFAPVLTIVLMPLFATFGYVAYRHIFLGQGLNNKVVEQQIIAST